MNSFGDVLFKMRYLLASFLLVAINSMGQPTYWQTVPDRARDSTYFLLPIHQYWYNQPWKDSVYRFDEFQQGRFEFANGFSPPTRLNMNYNIFLETVDTKDSLGVVRRMGKFPEMKFIWIGDQKFYNHPTFGYLEIIVDGTISVAAKTLMVLGIESQTGTVYSPMGVDYRTSAEPETRRYYPMEVLYIVDLDNKVHRIGSLLLPSLLPKMKHKIKAFADQNNIDYRNKGDIIKIVKFCNDNYVAPVKIVQRDSTYRFLQFDEALVRYKEGKAEASKRLNFDFTSGWFKTINERGDTLSLSKARTVTTVNIDGVLFMNDVVEGPVEVLKQGVVSFGMKKRIVNDELDLSYFFIKKNRALPATPRTLITLFPGHKEKINEYLTSYSVNFESREDMVKLLAYCERL